MEIVTDNREIGRLMLADGTSFTVGKEDVKRIIAYKEIDEHGELSFFRIVHEHKPAYKILICEMVLKENPK